MSIDEINYFTFSNNNDVISPSETRSNSILSLMTYHATSRMRWENTFRWSATRMLTAFISVRREDTWTFDTRQREPVVPVQTGLYQLETRLERSCEFRHVVRWILFIVSRLLAKKIWIFSDRQGQCAERTGNTEKDLTSSRYCNMTSSRCRYFARDEHGWCAREKIAREIEKTSRFARNIAF